jgi:hypothetical protein
VLPFGQLLLLQAQLRLQGEQLQQLTRSAGHDQVRAARSVEVLWPPGGHGKQSGHTCVKV